MELYRVFEWDGTSLGRRDGGPLFVARTIQGRSRHDNPSQFAAWYCSRDPVSATAELLQRFRGQRVDDDVFVRPSGRMKALVRFAIDERRGFFKNDDPTGWQQGAQSGCVYLARQQVFEHAARG